MNEILESYIRVRKQLPRNPGNVNDISGVVTLDAGLIADLKNLSQEEHARGTVYRDGNQKPSSRTQVADLDEKKHSGSDFEVELRLNRLLGGYLFFEQYQDALDEFTGALAKREFYVYQAYLETGSLEAGDSESPKRADGVKLIQSVGKLANLLEEVAFVVQPGPPKIGYFFSQGKLKLPLSLQFQDIADSDNVDRLVSATRNLEFELTKSDNKESRQEVFVSTLRQFLTEVAEDCRFKYLYQNLTYLIRQYKQEHERYLQEFTYEKLRNDFVDDKRQFMDRLSGAINQIQTKLITVPIAALLVAVRLDSGDPFEGINFVVIAALSIFAAMIYSLVDNQKVVLYDISEDIGYLKSEYQQRTDGKTLDDFINEGIRRLENKIEKQKAVISLFKFIIWTTSLVTLLFYLATVFRWMYETNFMHLQIHIESAWYLTAIVPFVLFLLFEVALYRSLGLQGNFQLAFSGSTGISGVSADADERR